MISNPFKRISGLVACGLTLIIGPAAEATVGPPVKITMPADAKQAVSGEVYDGVFDVEVGKPGRLADFKIHGDGWIVLSIDAADAIAADTGTFRIPFRARPVDANERISLSLTFEGRPVTRGYRVGPAALSRRGQPDQVVQVDGPPVQPESPSASAVRGDVVSFHVSGQIVYRRPDGLLVGLDHAWIQVKNDDDLVEELDPTMWEGETDEDGRFQADITEEDPGGPDVYLIVELETDVSNVMESDVPGSPNWDWSTEDTAFHYEDFTGSDLPFGTLEFLNDVPAMNIHNSIVRTHRFIESRSGIDVPQVDVYWPDGDDSPGAVYVCFPEGLYISHSREWREDTHSHEYGHHFECEFGETNEWDNLYCNHECDEDYWLSDCGHCMWCEEDEPDAWHEGFPDWLGDVVTRSYEEDYVDYNGCPYRPLSFRDLETPAVCDCCTDCECESPNVFGNPLITEGFVGALLRDFEDPMDLDGSDDVNTDGISDCLEMGAGPILQAVDSIEPDTIGEFLTGFAQAHPSHVHGMWKTGFNVAPEFVAGFPADTASPGPVTTVSSPTHPLGTGGPLPCVTAQWEPPSDDVHGAFAYSYIWSSTPNPGLEPDIIEEVQATCMATGFSPPLYPGEETYLRIRARDDLNHWGPSSAWLGPFQVNGAECSLHDNGIPDICDTHCSLVSAPISCQEPILFDYCAVYGSCQTSPDCNWNAVPDDCDIAVGTSLDCGDDGIPDECQSMRYWIAQNGSWHTPENWDASPPFEPGPCEVATPPASPGLPQSSDNVCIDASQEALVSYTVGASTVRSLACREDLTLLPQPGMPNAVLTLLEPSFISGDVTMGVSPRNPVLDVADELIISGSLNWSSGTIRGTGQTTVTGGHFVNGIVALQFHTLNLQCDTLVTAGGFGGGGNTNFTIRNFPGFTYTQAEGIVHQANGAMFVNEGLILKPSGAGVTRLDSPVNNSGEIRAEAGSMRFGPQLVSSGDIVGLPGTTLEFNGSLEFEPGSSLVGDQIIFSANASPNSRNVRGTYDADTGTTIQAGANVTFHPEADVIDYGDVLLLTSAVGHFDAVVGSTLNFQSITVGGSSTAYFTSGDPIVTDTLTLASSLAATIRGANKNITVNGLFTWNNGGSILDSGVINANGGLIVTACSSVKNLHCVLNNAATATIQGCFEVSQGGAVNNLATGVWDIQADGTIIYGSTFVFNNAGTLRKSAGAGTATLGIGGAIRPQINNTGTVEVQSGVLAFSRSDYTQTAGQTILSGGGLSMTGTSPGPVQINSGVLTGTGTVTANVNNAGGSVEPGLSAGQLTITGNYTQAPGGALEIELGGPTQGTDFDWLNISGAASLAGTLRVGLINGFTPVIGQQFVVVTAGSISGTFTAVESLTPELTLDVLYGPGTVTLEITGVGVPAAAITGAVSRKANTAGPGGICDLPLIPAVKSEPRVGGVAELRIAFDVPPGGPGTDAVTIEEKVCPAPGTYVPYSGASVISAGIAGNDLVITFTPGLANLHTYRLTMNPSVTSLPGQSVEVRGLVGDVDSSGRVNGVDRSAVIAVWTSGIPFSCVTDLDSSGKTNGTDRGLVIGAWTASSNCAP